MKISGSMIKHLIGNPLFAIETNLVSLERRTENIHESKEIIESMRVSVEKIKTVLEDLED
jgi:hypothetical protein